MALIRTNGGAAAGGLSAVFTIQYDATAQKTTYSQMTKDTAFTQNPYTTINTNNTQLFDNEYMTATKDNSSYWSFTVKKPCKWWRATNVDLWEWETLSPNDTRSNREFGTEMYVFE